MSIYVGTSNAQMPHATNNGNISRSVFVGKYKTWPGYEFSFFDNTMHLSHDGISPEEATFDIKIRTCEDSWWHRLNFHASFEFDQESTDYYLKYDALEYKYNENGSNPIYFNEIISCDNASIDGGNIQGKLDRIQTISFNNEYDTSTSIDNNTCSLSLPDTTLTYKIGRNDWFKQRSSSIYFHQYDENDHVSGSTIDNMKDMTDGKYVHTLSPSDNVPSIYIIQEANSWADGSTQNIELSVSPEEASNSSTTLNITWSISRLSKSGTRLYYGSNIVSNNQPIENYGNDKMKLTSSNPNLLIVESSVNKSIDKTGKCIWSATAKWADNTAGCNSYTNWDISFTQESCDKIISTDANGNVEVYNKYVYSAECNEVTNPRLATITLNLYVQGNWEAQSISKNVSQLGQSIGNTCTVSPNPCYTESVSASGGNATYYLTCDKNSVSSDEDDEEGRTFTVTSYKTTSGISGKGATITAIDDNCSSHTSSINVSGVTVNGSESFVSVNVECMGEAVQLISQSGNTATYMIDPHPSTSEIGKITITQNESNKFITLSHDKAKSQKLVSYSYYIVINDTGEYTHKSTIEYDPNGETSKSTYCHVKETCECYEVTQDDNGNEVRTKLNELSYSTWITDDVNQSVVYDDGQSRPRSSGVKLSDCVFTCSNIDNQSSVTVSGDSLVITISLDANNQNSPTDTLLRSELSIVDDSCTDITAKEAGELAFSYTIQVNAIYGKGGQQKLGVYNASLNGASVSCNWYQDSIAETIETGSYPIEGLSGSAINVSVSQDGFDYIVNEGNAGEYTINVYIKTQYIASNVTSNSTISDVTMKPLPSMLALSCDDKGQIKNFSVAVSGTKTYGGDDNKIIRYIYSEASYENSSIITSNKSQRAITTSITGALSGVSVTFETSIVTNSGIITVITDADGNATAGFPITTVCGFGGTYLYITYGEFETSVQILPATGCTECIASNTYYIYFVGIISNIDSVTHTFDSLKYSINGNTYTTSVGIDLKYGASKIYNTIEGTYIAYAKVEGETSANVTYELYDETGKAFSTGSTSIVFDEFTTSYDVDVSSRWENTEKPRYVNISYTISNSKCCEDTLNLTLTCVFNRTTSYTVFSNKSVSPGNSISATVNTISTGTTSYTEDLTYVLTLKDSSTGLTIGTQSGTLNISDASYNRTQAYYYNDISYNLANSCTCEDTTKKYRIKATISVTNNKSDYITIYSLQYSENSSVSSFGSYYGSIAPGSYLTFSDIYIDVSDPTASYSIVLVTEDGDAATASSGHYVESYFLLDSDGYYTYDIGVLAALFSETIFKVTFGTISSNMICGSESKNIPYVIYYKNGVNGSWVQQTTYDIKPGASVDSANYTASVNNGYVTVTRVNGDYGYENGTTLTISINDSSVSTYIYRGHIFGVLVSSSSNLSYPSSNYNITLKVSWSSTDSQTTGIPSFVTSHGVISNPSSNWSVTSTNTVIGTNSLTATISVSPKSSITDCSKTIGTFGYEFYLDDDVCVSGNYASDTVTVELSNIYTDCYIKEG